MKVTLLLILLGLFSSCGGSGGDSSSSTSETLQALSNSRKTISALSSIVGANEAKSLIDNIVLNSGWTDAATNEYPSTDNGNDDTNLSIKGWFQRELDSNRILGDSGSNLFNRIDYSFIYLCALTYDLGEALDVTEEKILTITHTILNSTCGTKLSTAQQVSLTGAKAVVESISGAQFERKVSIYEKEEDGSYPQVPTDIIYITNNASRIRFSFGYYESPYAKRTYYDLDKTNGDLTVEYIEIEGNQSIYRILKTGSTMLALGRSEQGTGSRYTFQYDIADNRAKIIYDMGRRSQDASGDSSVCLNTETSLEVNSSECEAGLSIAAGFNTLDLTVKPSSFWESSQDKTAPFSASNMFQDL